MKKLMWSVGITAVILIVAAFLLGRYAFPHDPSTDTLPAPELAAGERGALGIDANINESTIDQYLGRSDSVYRDVRMLEDPGNYAAIDGDSMLSGYVDGFEVVPYPYLVNVEGLPEAVGQTYTGPTLFTHITTTSNDTHDTTVDNNNNSSNNNSSTNNDTNANSNTTDTYTPNYAESMDILEALFPKDKNIFLMCGGGGYSGMLKNMLTSLGWDANKIYDVGGYWFYDGDHNVEVKRLTNSGETVYDFYKVPYHNIDFNTLIEVVNG